MTKYPLPHNFFSDTAMHCVALFLLDSSIGKQPTESDINATLTFVEYDGKTYGITCKHVVDIFKNKETSEKNTCFATLTKGKYIILNNFVCPQSDCLILPAPDIAIRQIHPDFPKAIGKIPIKLEQQSLHDLRGIKHAFAVGYPTKQKKKINVQNGYRIEMRCVHALAEITPISNNHLLLYAELDQPVKIQDFSGMSGGPVFWTNENKYGLLGIIYEALPPNPGDLTPSDSSLGEGPRICIKAELLTPERFEVWSSKDQRLTEEINWIKDIKLNVNLL